MIDRVRPAFVRLTGALTIAVMVAALWTVPALAAFPGDNGRIVFARGNAIVSQTAGGTEKVLATGIVTAPSYSANGRKIVYLRGSMDFGPGWFDVLTMNADGTGKRNVTKSVDRYESPTFSPSGARIMFELYDGNPMGTHRLYTIGADGTGRRQFAPTVPGGMEDGVWSPNGNRVAYAGGAVGDPLTLRTIRSNGDRDTVRRLAPDVTNVSHPDWSPNNQRLVFTRRGSIASNKFMIFRINADKTGLVKLVDDGNDRGADDAVWSPEGNRIAFTRTNFATGATPKVWTMKPGGGDRTRFDANGYEPSWQPRP